MRIHRSHTIAIDKVQSVEGISVEVDGIRYTIGRSYIKDAKRRIVNNVITKLLIQSGTSEASL